MRARLLSAFGLIVAIVAAPALFERAHGAVAGQARTSPAKSASSAGLKTPWGDPDLQGIWTYEFDTPLQRPAKYQNQEFFTAEQEAELDRQRAALQGRDKRVDPGTRNDVAGAYNSVFNSVRHLGR